MRINGLGKYIDINEYFNNSDDFYNTANIESLLAEDYARRLCYDLSLLKNNPDMEGIVKRIIKIDTTGEVCYQIALVLCQWPCGQMAELEDVIIEKDTTGEWCRDLFLLNKCHNKANVEAGLIKNDTDGRFCTSVLALDRGLNNTALQDAIIEKDATGQYCRSILGHPDLDNEKIKEAICEKEIAINGYVKDFD